MILLKKALGPYAYAAVLMACKLSCVTFWHLLTYGAHVHTSNKVNASHLALVVVQMRMLSCHSGRNRYQHVVVMPNLLSKQQKGG